MKNKVEKPKLVVVVGPTASGKTNTAVEIAKRFNGEVISADSRQVYRKLDIGTAKTTEEEMDGIPHYLIDVVDVDQIYTAADFKKDASEAIEDINSQNKLPIIAGGTFFYVDTLLGRVTAPEVPPNEKLRAELDKLDTTVLVRRLQTLAPRRYLNIDTSNRRRLIRAIEIATSLGYVPETNHTECPYEVLIIGIQVEKEILRGKFKQRAEEWLEGGFKAEVESLLNDGITRERLSEIGFEYKLGLELFDGQISNEEFVQKFIEKNWQYAKRQLTWLKRDESIKWFEKDDYEIFDVVERFLR